MNSLNIFFDEETKRIDSLYHFTKFKNFKSIISNCCLYMTQINDNLNDKKEKEYVKGIEEYYITCFTSEMNELFWNHKDYGENEKYAVCIKLNSKRLSELVFRYENGEEISNGPREFGYLYKNNYSDFRLHGVSIHKVIYKENPMDDLIIDEELYNNYKGCANLDREEIKKKCTRIKNRGYVKSVIDCNGNDQSYENEHRVITILTYKGARMIEPLPYHKITKILLDFSNIKNDVVAYVKKGFECKEEFVEICQKYGIKYEIVE